MSELNKNKRRKSGSGRFGYEQKCLREADKAYKTPKLKDVTEKALPTEQINTLTRIPNTHGVKSCSKNIILKTQTLTNLMHPGSVKRRKYGTYEDPVSSKRQTTIGYTIPTESSCLLRFSPDVTIAQKQTYFVFSNVFGKNHEILHTRRSD